MVPQFDLIEEKLHFPVALSYYRRCHSSIPGNMDEVITVDVAQVAACLCSWAPSPLSFSLSISIWVFIRWNSLFLIEYNGT